MVLSDFSGRFARRIFEVFSEPRRNTDGHGQTKKQKLRKQKTKIGARREERRAARNWRREGAARPAATKEFEKEHTEKTEAEKFCQKCATFRHSTTRFFPDFAEKKRLRNMLEANNLYSLRPTGWSLFVDCKAAETNLLPQGCGRWRRNVQQSFGLFLKQTNGEPALPGRGAG